MAIIAFSGYAGSGKDTAGGIIMQQQSSEGWKNKKFADKLRQVAALFLGLPIAYLYTDEFKKSTLSPVWNYKKQIMENDENRQDSFTTQQMTGREFLQKLGTDAIRFGLHPDAWVNALMADYIGKVSQGGKLQMPNWVITDMRFPNEMQSVQDRNGITIRIHRWPTWFIKEYPGFYLGFLPRQLRDIDRKAYQKWDGWRQSLHESETSLDNARFDFVINNNGTVDELKHNLLIISKPKDHEQTQVYQAQNA